MREERAASYSPFLPICPRTGMVLYVPIVEHDVKAGTVSYDDPETKVMVFAGRGKSRVTETIAVITIPTRND